MFFTVLNENLLKRHPLRSVHQTKTVCTLNTSSMPKSKYQNKKIKIKKIKNTNLALYTFTLPETSIVLETVK